MKKFKNLSESKLRRLMKGHGPWWIQTKRGKRRPFRTKHGELVAWQFTFCSENSTVQALCQRYQKVKAHGKKALANRIVKQLRIKYGLWFPPQPGNPRDWLAGYNPAVTAIPDAQGCLTIKVDPSRRLGDILNDLRLAFQGLRQIPMLKKGQHITAELRCGSSRKKINLGSFQSYKALFQHVRPTVVKVWHSQSVKRPRRHLSTLLGYWQIQCLRSQGLPYKAIAERVDQGYVQFRAQEKQFKAELRQILQEKWKRRQTVDRPLVEEELSKRIFGTKRVPKLDKRHPAVQRVIDRYRKTKELIRGGYKELR